MNIQPKDPSIGHFLVSVVKSAFRIAAGISLAVGNFVTAGVMFVIAEILGIVEELV